MRINSKEVDKRREKQIKEANKTKYQSKAIFLIK